MRNLIAATVAMLCVLALSTEVLAQGVVVWHDSASMPGPNTGVYIKQAIVNVSIEDQIATTSLEQVFVNGSGRPQEGTFLLPIPEGAAVTNFCMLLDGQKLETKLLTREEAQRIYDSIVSRLKDPALLTFSGRQALQAKVFPIPPGGERRLRIEYSEVVSSENGMCRYQFPLDIAKSSARPLQNVTVVINLKSDKAIKGIFCPSHLVSIDRPNDRSATISYEENNVSPDRDMLLYYLLSEEEFGLNFLTHRKAGEDGYFVLMLAPKVEFKRDEVIAKDVVFIIDTSGSMAGQKLAQAKKALEFCLNSLNEADRFNIITFNTAVISHAGKLVPASPENVSQGIAFFKNNAATGGTNINEALQTGLKMLESNDRAKMVVFLTDGLPTVGEMDIQKVLENAVAKNVAGARVFAFGVGDDVNTHLLDKLSGAHHGCSDYVRPTEDIEVKVSNFFGKVAAPVLTNVEIDYGGAGVYDCFPKVLPDVFKGSQITVFGRYRAGGNFAIRLKGDAEGRKRVYVHQRELAQSSEKDIFIPRLWATRKIGYLLDQIELHGRSKEVVEEIVDLSRKYGVMTEYTAFLIDAEGSASRPEIISQALQNMRDATLVQNGAQAVGRAQNRGFWGANTQVAANQIVLSDGSIKNVERVRFMGGKTFYLRNGRWVDSEITGEEQVVEVSNFSADYFRLNRGRNDIGQAQSLGGELLIRDGDKVYLCK